MLHTTGHPPMEVSIEDMGLTERQRVAEKCPSDGIRRTLGNREPKSGTVSSFYSSNQKLLTVPDFVSGLKSGRATDRELCTSHSSLRLHPLLQASEARLFVLALSR